jgi:HSP20 family protein
VNWTTFGATLTIYLRGFWARPRGLERFIAAPTEVPVESFIEGDKLIVRAELSGVDRKDVEVTISGNMLTIRATKEERHEKKERDFIQQEISYGRIERSLTLPPGTTGENIKASFQNGVLELTVPIPKELSTRKVTLQIENDGGNGREEANQQQETKGQEGAKQR